MEEGREMEKVKRISKKQCRLARGRAKKIIEDLRKKVRDKYIFSDSLVGSGKWGTMMSDLNGEYDLDYQILLTHNSKEYNKTKQKFDNPTKIKNDFYEAFDSIKNKHEKFENSTTAITLKNSQDDKPFHIDFVIIDPNKNQIVRRNNKSEILQKNEFTWNSLPSKHFDTFNNFKQFNSNDKRKLIEEKIIPAKAKEKRKSENDPTKISSCEVFIKEINNYRRENERDKR
ncbi:MAG: hypothetical protein LBN07_04780 [Christensenellaceae bacterium]|nr:hypothetical protein [Christensenellaceae bacterium]